MKKNAKKNDANNNSMISEIKDEFKRHTTALMEHMTKEVKIVAEGHGILVKKSDRVESDLGEVKKDIAIIKPIVAANSKDLKEIKSVLHSMNMAIMETSHEIKDHKKRIKKVEEKVFA